MKRVKLRPDGSVDKRSFNGGHPTPGGTGRPVGAKNKFPVGLRSRSAQAHMEAGGIMPLDFMLACLRGNKVGGGAGKDKWEFPVTWEDKKWAADKLLHCFTPKLTNTTLKGTVQVLALPPESLKNLSQEELKVMEKALGKLAGENPSGYDNVQGYSEGPGIVPADAYAEMLNDEGE